MLNDIIQVYLTRSDYIAKLIGEHLQLSATAIAWAMVLGLALGILIAELPKLSLPVLGITNVLYTIPSIAFFGFLIPLVGIGNKNALIVLVLYALLPMVRNTYAGLTNIAPAILEAGRGMGSTRAQMLLRIKLPLALPVIMAGIRNMVVMVIATCSIAAFIGAGGLGNAIFRGITTYNMGLTYAGSILIALMALISDTLLGLVERHLTYKITGQRSKKHEKKNN